MMAWMLTDISTNPNASPIDVGDCAGCMECCTNAAIGTGVPDADENGNPVFERLIPKDAGERCRWQVAAGCVIYADRPFACRSYRCWALELLSSGFILQYHQIIQQLSLTGARVA